MRKLAVTRFRKIFHSNQECIRTIAEGAFRQVHCRIIIPSSPPELGGLSRSEICFGKPDKLRVGWGKGVSLGACRRERTDSSGSGATGDFGIATKIFGKRRR